MQCILKHFSNKLNDMSSNISHYLFQNCSCEQHNLHHFNGACMCVNTTCGYPAQFHGDDNIITNNNKFSTPPPHELLQFPITLKDFNNDKNSNQELSAPNHRNFLPIIEGETAQTNEHVPASNHNEATLDKEFEPHEQNSGRKRNYTFKLSILLRMSARMCRLNPNITKHKEFLAITQFGHDLAINKCGFTKPPHQEIKEATQARAVEDVSNTDCFQFLGQKSDVNNAWSTAHYNKFDHACSSFKKANKNKALCLFYIARCLASKCEPHFSSRLPMFNRRFTSATALANPTVSSATNVVSQISQSSSFAMRLFCNSTNDEEIVSIDNVNSRSTRNDTAHNDSAPQNRKC